MTSRLSLSRVAPDSAATEMEASPSACPGSQWYAFNSSVEKRVLTVTLYIEQFATLTFTVFLGMAICNMRGSIGKELWFALSRLIILPHVSLLDAISIAHRASFSIQTSAI